jgi:predicted XRE-type DNA-binding protein
MSDSGGDSGDEWVYGEGKEWLEGRHKKENRSAYRHAAEIGNTRLRKLYTKAKAAYDRLAEKDRLSEGMPASFYDTRLARQIRRIDGTETFSRAVHDGDAGVVRSMVGSPDAQADISGLHAIDKLEDMIGEDAFLEYLWAEPGSGKTSFALLEAQLWKRAHPDGEVGSNIRSLKEKDEWIRSFGDLDRWLTKDAEDALEGNAIPKLFIFDEANSHASGRGADGYEVASKLGPLVYKIRKYGGSLIIIGHDGKDIHPAVRELAIAVEKTGLKAATFYDTVDNRKGRGEIMQITGIPDTDWRYNDKEPTTWSWGDEEQEKELESEAMELAEEHVAEEVRDTKQEIAQEMVNNGVSQSEIAEYLGVSQGTISNWTD